MKTATLTLQTRSRRFRLVKWVVRIAALVHSRRLARWALTLSVVEYRVENGPWERIPVSDYVWLD